MSTGEWSGKGWTVTATDTEMALAQASGSVTISGANAGRLEVRRRRFRWRLHNEGQPLVRLRGITKIEAAAPHGRCGVSLWHRPSLMGRLVRRGRSASARGAP
jgi:hypothetical protein